MCIAINRACHNPSRYMIIMRPDDCSQLLFIPAISTINDDQIIIFILDCITHTYFTCIRPILCYNPSTQIPLFNIRAVIQIISGYIFIDLVSILIQKVFRHRFIIFKHNKIIIFRHCLCKDIVIIWILRTHLIRDSKAQIVNDIDISFHISAVH